MCAHVCVCVCTSVISGLSIVFRICANPLNTLHLYTARIAFIFVIWAYVSIYFTQATWCDEKRLIDAKRCDLISTLIFT